MRSHGVIRTITNNIRLSARWSDAIRMIVNNIGKSADYFTLAFEKPLSGLGSPSEMVGFGIPIWDRNSPLK